MGRQSRLKRTRRDTPARFVRGTLETRWGSAPPARAFGGMMQGLGLGLLLAVVCLVFGVIRILVTDNRVRDLAQGTGWYFGGWLLGGAVAGALAPVRHRMGGRRAQGIVMAGIVMAVWTPLINRELEPDPGMTVFTWALCTVIFGLIFARFLSILDPDPPAPPGEGVDSDAATGRRHPFRP